LFANLDPLLRVVEVHHAFVVAGGVGKDAAITRKENGNRVEVCQIAPRLLCGDDIEPAKNLGDQPMILVTAILRAKVRYIPRRKKERVVALGRNEAVLLLAPVAQSRDFGINVVLKFKSRFREFGHGLRLVDSGSVLRVQQKGRSW
jgi:hypothetical protein